MNRNLLLVDDEPNIVSAIRRALQQGDYKMLTASNAKDALGLLDEHQVDVVISDHRMPGMTGVELLTEVSQKYPNTVRLMLSGEADMEVVIDAVNNGSVFKFITKPWNDEELRDLVNEAMEESRAAKIHPATGWLNHIGFCEAIDTLIKSQPLRIVVGELKNASAVLNLLSLSQQRSLAEQIEYRCRESHELLLPMASLDGGLIAFATQNDIEAPAQQTLLEQFSVPIEIDGRLIPLRVGFGYVDSNSAELSAVTLLRKATLALNSASFKSNNQVVAYTANTTKNLQMRDSLEREMKHSLAQEEFYLVAQPQVCLESMQIEGAESLLRWKNKQLGLISPMRFIGLAERNGLIHEIGFWVMQKVSELLVAMAKKKLGKVRLSFNVSPVQFSHEETTNAWIEYLTAFALEHPSTIQNLELEITETTIMTNPDRAIDILSRLKELGIRIALDDFGTGYSSLSQLNKLPIDVLKFDRSLLVHIESDSKSRILLSHLSKMANDLDLEIVAEGVETQYQVNFCRHLNIDHIQGFAFYRPLSMEAFYCELDNQYHDRKH